MIWIVFFGDKIGKRFIAAYFFIASCIIVAGTLLKLNYNPMANLFLMTGLGLTFDTLLMLTYKKIKPTEKRQK